MIKKYFKKKLFKFLSKYDYKLYKTNYNQILKKIVNKHNPVIFDVGANQGQSIEFFSKLYHKPIIHSFEPVSSCYELIKTKYQNEKNIFINNLALGDRKQLKKIYVTPKTQNSSFYPININSKWFKDRSQKQKLSHKDFKNIENVKVETIDNYFKNSNLNKIDLLKIDTQGYEAMILKGAKKTIKEKKILAISCEIIFDDTYNKNLSFYEIEKHLLDGNFRLVALNFSEPNLFQGIKFDANALYVKHELIDF